MKRIISTALVATVLMSLSAAAGTVKAKEDLSNVLSKEVKTQETAVDARTLQVSDVSTKLASIGRDTQAHGSMATVAFSKNLTTAEGDVVNALQISQSIITSSEVLADSTKVGNSLDKSATELKASIESANQAYSSGLIIILAKVSDPSTKEGQAIAKLLLMGKSISRGELSVEQARSYENLVRGMSDLLKTSSAKTSEEALGKTLEQLGLKKDAKINELAGCKV